MTNYRLNESCTGMGCDAADYSFAESQRPAPPKNNPAGIPPVVAAPDKDGREPEAHPSTPPARAGTVSGQ